MGTHRATRSVTHAHASGGGYGRVAGCPSGGGIGRVNGGPTGTRTKGKRDDQPGNERESDAARSGGESRKETECDSDGLAQAPCSHAGMYPRETSDKHGSLYARTRTARTVYEGRTRCRDLQGCFHARHRCKRGPTTRVRAIHSEVTLGLTIPPFNLFFPFPPRQLRSDFRMTRPVGSGRRIRSALASRVVRARR